MMNSRKWMLIASAAAILCLLDGIFTVQLGTEINPILASLFAKKPELVVAVKLLAIPIFHVLGLEAVKGHRLVRYALIFIAGWYAAVVVMQMANLYTLGNV